jgi:hypothetical protein
MKEDLIRWLNPLNAEVHISSGEEDELIEGDIDGSPFAFICSFPWLSSRKWECRTETVIPLGIGKESVALYRWMACHARKQLRT